MKWEASDSWSWYATTTNLRSYERRAYECKRAVIVWHSDFLLRSYNRPTRQYLWATLNSSWCSCNLRRSLRLVYYNDYHDHSRESAAESARRCSLRLSFVKLSYELLRALPCRLYYDLLNAMIIIILKHLIHICVYQFYAINLIQLMILFKFIKPYYILF